MEPRWLDETEMRAWLTVVGATGRLFGQLNDEIESQHGLSHGDYGILADLSASPGGALRMTELAMARLVSKSGLTHHVARLEADGLVKRRACPTDRRGAEAVLTAKGRRVLEKAAPDHVTSVRAHFFDHLTREQVRVLGDALGRVEAHLREVQGG